MHVYMKLFSSAVSWYQSRGLRFASASFTTACAFTLFGFVNFVSLTVLIQILGKTKLSDWIGSEFWVDCVVAAALGIVHIRMANRFSRQGRKQHDPTADGGVVSRYFWLWYFVLTLILLVSTAIVSLAE